MQWASSQPRARAATGEATQAALAGYVLHVALQLASQPGRHGGSGRCGGDGLHETHQPRTGPPRALDAADIPRTCTRAGHSSELASHGCSIDGRRLCVGGDWSMQRWRRVAAGPRPARPSDKVLKHGVKPHGPRKRGLRIRPARYRGAVGAHGQRGRRRT